MNSLWGHIFDVLACIAGAAAGFAVVWILWSARLL